MFKTLKHISEAIEFMQLPDEMRKVVFYSEGKSHLNIVIMNYP